MIRNASQIASRAILLYETALARLVLTTVVESTPCLGRPPARGFVAATLSGSLRRDLVRVDAHRLATFGMLAPHTLDRILAMIEALERVDLLERLAHRSGLVVTARGRSLLEQDDPTLKASEPLGILAGAVPAEDLDLSVRSGLVDALRRVRASWAASEEIPEYRVFSEATLRELAARLPAADSDLELIPGLGPKRRASYAHELLRIVAEHAPIIERLRNGSTRSGDEVDGPEPAAPLRPYPTQSLGKKAPVRAPQTEPPHRLSATEQSLSDVT